MGRRDSPMYQVLKAGVSRTLKESGFKPRTRRVFVREHDDGYAFVDFKADKYGGDKFDNLIGIYLHPIQEIYEQLFPDGIGDLYFPDDRWWLLCHAVTSLQMTCMVDVAPTPEGPHAYRIERNEIWQDWQAVTRHAGRSGGWKPDLSDIPGAADDWIAAWRESGVRWIEYARDPAFIASRIVFDRPSVEYCWCHAAVCYALVGDPERARRMLADCLAAAAVPLDEFEMQYRGSRFLGFGIEPSTERSRSKAAVQFEHVQRAAIAARRIADHFGLVLS